LCVCWLLELDVVRKYISLLMAKDFRQGNPGRYPIPTERVGWFMQGTFAKVQTPYVQTIWAEIDDTLHIETDSLGDTIDMTEWMYGDESLYDRGSMDLTGFDRIEGRSEYAKKFPRVVGRLNSYERLASKLAEKLDVDMGVRVSGMKGIAWFRLGAKFGTSGMPTLLILHHIDTNVAALREAFYAIAERQRTLYYMWSKAPGY
jgi:hypothetical protein